MLIRSATIRIGVAAALGALAAQGCKTVESGVLNAPGGGGGSEQPAPAEEAAAQPGNNTTYGGLVGGVSEAENAQMFAKYCVSNDVTQPVVPNYDDEDVAKAAKILSTIKPTSFKLYADMMKMHQTTMPTGVPGLNKSAHDFLTYLCGEFRDRAPMIRAKLNWVLNIRYLASSGGGQNKSCANRNDPLMGNAAEGALPAVGTFDRAKSPWQQMCTEDYQPYLAISRQVFDYRQAALRQPGGTLEGPDGPLQTGRLTIGTHANIDRAVPGYSICETKYMFAEYVKKQKQFGSGAQAYQAYMTGYNAFKAGCTAEDNAYYYDFRGDSNYKPNSPEGNGMIWQGKVAAAQCKNRTQAKAGMSMTDADCRAYYEHPFMARWMGARAGLATWLQHAKESGAAFGNNSGAYFTVVNHAQDNPAHVFGDTGPFLYRLNDTFTDGKLATPGQPGPFMQGFQGYWGAPDLGMVALSGYNGEQAKQFVFERLQRSVDRHTNWYKSSYDSAPNLPIANNARRTIDQAYTPFVASSYEMDQSNGFSQCGLTIPCGNNPEYAQWKQWMFIFKVKKENWFTPEKIVAGQLNPDMDRVWLDETAFGEAGLADRERAWDRLGTPLEDELAEILYLHRIPAQ